MSQPLKDNEFEFSLAAQLESDLAVLEASGAAFDSDLVRCRKIIDDVHSNAPTDRKVSLTEEIWKVHRTILYYCACGVCSQFRSR